ncbi:hypothetical protein EDEG_00291 [Edhazardia aedis USNM 41457]|uniref:Glutaredoxin domain-containing protein n=1 Tax=Edhazardia aedis (strain USNM 41457) TaxID=1003232 RepID=J9DLY7_EDHAE|nr:hypothetical protein EDEG_00291 [Edhazardia aedis USNM 41457]|eukprot:EJW02397.1 hypothetical protein EDEG_00291 [Edhazardia aedis USNM 41457]
MEKHKGLRSKRFKHVYKINVDMISILLLTLAGLIAQKFKSEIDVQKVHIKQNNVIETSVLSEFSKKAEAVVIGRQGCPFCEGAVMLLMANKVDFAYYSAENHGYLRDEAFKLYNHRTVPVIFLNNAFVGGFKELNERFAHEECC